MDSLAIKSCDKHLMRKMLADEKVGRSTKEVRRNILISTDLRIVENFSSLVVGGAFKNYLISTEKSFLSHPHSATLHQPH